MNKIDNVVDFVYEIEQYLFAWLCIYEGKYELKLPWGDFERLFLYQYLPKTKDAIKSFKDDVLAGKIIFSFPSISSRLLTPKNKKELYKTHKATVQEFERKYNM